MPNGTGVGQGLVCIQPAFNRGWSSLLLALNYLHHLFALLIKDILACGFPLAKDGIIEVQWHERL